MARSKRKQPKKPNTQLSTGEKMEPIVSGELPQSSETSAPAAPVAAASPSHADEEAPDGCMSAILRLFWMAGGNVLLLLAAMFIAQGMGGVIADALFFATVALLILIRFFDITRFAGETSQGTRATLSHWRRYVLTLLLASGGIYALARTAAHFQWM